jgi:hypothetical protein
MEPLAATAMATFGRRFCTGRFLFDVSVDLMP